jgi:hypothetical protein
MSISTVTYNGSLAYQLAAGETLTCYPFGVLNMDYVSAGCAIYAAETGGEITLSVRFISSAGLILTQLDEVKAASDTNIWERVSTYWALETGAVQAEVRFYNSGSSTVLFAQPKAAAGKELGTYANNYSPQLSKITPSGIYTGTITTEQVIIPGSSATATLNAYLLQMVSSNNSKFTAADSKISGTQSDLDAAEQLITRIQAGEITLSSKTSMSGTVSQGSFAQHTTSSSKYQHSDGSYTQISADGIKRYTSGTGNEYHYLMSVTTFVSGDTTTKWVQLPDEFKGKYFDWYCGVADSMQARDDDLNGRHMIMRFVATQANGQSTDYTNAKVPVVAYKMTQQADLSDRRISNIQGFVIAIA